MDRPETLAMFLPALGAIFSLLCLFAALRDGRHRRLIDNLPTSKTTGVFIGLVELKGTAESSAPVTSNLTEQPCVLYDWNIDERWSRTVTETYTDSNGHTQTRTRTESGWTTVDSGGESVPFYLQDDCGMILVRPSGARIEPVTLLDETFSPSDPIYYGKGPDGAIGNSDYVRRFVETAIPLHRELYVMGQARERKDVVAPEIAADKQAQMFLISCRTEQQVSSGYAGAFWGWSIFGLVLAAGGFIGRDLAMQIEPANRIPIYIATAVGYLFVCVLGWIWMVFNSMVELRQRVRQAWSQVDVQLRRRHDLIPNLVAVVQGLRDHEKQVQTEVAELRGQLAATPPGVSGPDYRAVNRSVIAIAERYPDLKANATFTGLQQNLVDTEQRIALARGYFNDIATFYNTRLQIVPDRFVARLAAMKREALMEANEFERAPVEVKLV